MSSLFVADIHLCAQEPEITATFLRFLRTQALSAQSLYILGDLFEVWIGDDDPNPLHNKIAIALQSLNHRGISCYFVHGNRDFLLGKRYAAACGMTLLPTQQVMNLNGFRILILHGDTLCTDDIEYQDFRYWVHQRWLQQLFLSLPLQLRLGIADRMRAKSLRANAGKSADIMDVNTYLVMEMMEHSGATIMIHGHTHRPEIHKLSGERQRAVLGAWHRRGSAIQVSIRGITPHEFPVSD
ncbi:UDP-2,3-diacylglucosamine diphosphatase [Candidatus Steffania adelgidicola]|uniref:UDP-2,3-diacylglucosamine diphosphatase n=1 Tax=Candidatus Steffania adelgidicola TaxID=1076626 RepID=UPI001D0188C2|nr:UDP-2,3-diacylglucosamine diphosphatase [Candidatus Steffania adelgidicola]UDG79646.1 UDP-2,3-diacylglucosamine hydrolase [Candidatus Steffania adelgidicola]